MEDTGELEQCLLEVWSKGIHGPSACIPLCKTDLLKLITANQRFLSALDSVHSPMACQPKFSYANASLEAFGGGGLVPAIYVLCFVRTERLKQLYQVLCYWGHNPVAEFILQPAEVHPSQRWVPWCRGSAGSRWFPGSCVFLDQGMAAWNGMPCF